MDERLSARKKMEREEEKRAFCERLNKVISTTGIGTAHLACLCGVGSGAVYSWKEGKAKPASPDTWARLAFALNVSERWLRGESVAMARTQTDAATGLVSAKKEKKHRPNVDGLPPEGTNIYYHAPPDHYEKIKAIAQEHNITLRAALARCLAAYFDGQKEAGAEDENTVKIELEESHKMLLRAMAKALDTTPEQFARDLLQSEIWRLSAPLRLDIKLKEQKKESKAKEPCAADRPL